MPEQPEPDALQFDPDFDAKAAAFTKADDEAFASWLAEDKFAELIDNALEAGRAAFKVSVDLSEEDDPRWTLAVIDLGHRRAKPLVRTLAGRGLGRTEILSYTFETGFDNIMGKRMRATRAQAHAVVEAFALALSKLGFELQIWRGS